LNFFVWNTTPGSGRVGDVLEHGLLAASCYYGAPLAGVPSAGLVNLANEVADLRDHVSSKDVTIANFTFTSLSKTVNWTTHNLPSDPDQALVCLDAPTLLHSIGKEFYIDQDTREAPNQNKMAGISIFSLTLHSSFSTVLPEILGKNVTVGVEDSGLLLPCAKTYKDCFYNDNGVMTGVKPRILEDIENQRAVHDTILDNLGYTHTDGAAMGRKLLYCSCNFLR
jgi:hypothetical protein